MSNPSASAPPSLVSVLGVSVAIVAAAVIALVAEAPPPPLPATAPATMFSAERAMVHVRALAAEPHQAGSEANTRAREYLVRQLATLGVAAEVVTAYIVDGRKAAEVHNVLARIPGRAGGKAFAVTAHYDSVRYGPGAADDIAGVAAMLEAARAIKAGPPLRNDVLLIFTDAEEAGLLGAKAFARHPWIKEIGVLLGLEARGNRGPSLIFESSRDNGWLIAQLAAAGVSPRASSLAVSVYEVMSFNGDFSYLKRQGIAGFQAAFVEGFAQYHTRDDSPANLSPASLQHHGEYVLGLARQFGNLPLEQVTAPDAVYFNVPGFGLAYYPLAWSGPLTAAALALCAAALALGFRHRHLTVRGALGGAVAAAGVALVASAVVTLLLVLVFGPVPLSDFYRSGLTQLSDLRPFHHNELYGLAFTLAVTAVVVGSFTWLRDRWSVADLAAGAMIWWMLLLLVLQITLPGGSYLGAWPLLFAAAQILLLFRRSQEPAMPAARLTPLVLPAVLLLVPVYRHLVASVLFVTAPVWALLPVLLAGLLLPQLDLVVRRFRWSLTISAGGAALLLIGYGLASSAASPERPGVDCVAYGLDKDAGRAFWLSSDQTVDEWTEQFFPAGTPRDAVADFFPRFHRTCLRTLAPLAGFAGPELHKISDVTSAGRRKLTLKIRSPDSPDALVVHMVSDTEVFSAAVWGQAASGARRSWVLDFKTFPRDGVTLTLEVAASAPVTLKLVSQHFRLPEFPGIRPRPAHLMVEPNTLNNIRSIRSDQILVTRTFELPSVSSAGGN